MTAINDNDRRNSILVVHGDDFKPSQAALMDGYVAALRAGIERDYPDAAAPFDALDKSLAYYGDLNNETLSRAGRHFDEQLDIGDRGNALQQLCQLSRRRKFSLRQYDSLPGKSALPEAVADIAAPLLGMLGLTVPLISLVSKDFARYVRGKGVFAEQIRDRVRTELCELLQRGDRVLLISHGTGSAVTYDVLWQLSHDPRFIDDVGDAKVDVWLTCGSPLSDNGIRRRLLGAGKKSVQRFPTIVVGWHNVSAEDDYVCHDKTIADDLKMMLKERVISSVADYRVYNLAVRYGRSDPHCALGYYIHPRVAKIVVDWMNDSPEAG